MEKDYDQYTALDNVIEATDLLYKALSRLTKLDLIGLNYTRKIAINASILELIQSASLLTKTLADFNYKAPKEVAVE